MLPQNIEECTGLAINISQSINGACFNTGIMLNYVRKCRSKNDIFFNYEQIFQVDDMKSKAISLLEAEPYTCTADFSFSKKVQNIYVWTRSLEKLITYLLPSYMITSSLVQNLGVLTQGAQH